ncbi:uncharacterized protein BXZ73DRAFT_74115 [Epithele typhae]|uniref:uncharacterized protein n=1 Tax=Epithele typhae TaxID=378194 RepID=UPI002008D786|nr:uncharacterized protein BXZ73DRAFT_74115 [Epithele typhae]KAH9943069.1 hypothetical protein BXZ73DRAFT_74115 [Epithele typhae]
MTALPSFIELMATLGIDDPTPEPSKLAAPHHSRSSSHSSTASTLSASSSNHKHSSPAIVVSALNGPEDSEMPADIRRSRAHTRYSPYGAISHSRKASMPISTESSPARVPFDELRQALSTSPRLSPISASFRGRRSRRPDNLNLNTPESESMAYTPISSYVRRRTPQNSPTSPTFARTRERSSTIAHPLTIPTLPTLLSPASFATQSSDSEEDDMDAIPDSEYKLGQSSRVQALSPSRYGSLGSKPARRAVMP